MAIKFGNEVNSENIVSGLTVGDTFSYHDKVWLIVTPVRFLEKSNLMKEVIGRGDRIAVRLDNGELAAWSGTTIIDKVELTVTNIAVGE